MSWISNLFSPRKRSASEADDGSEGILGSVLKRLKPEGPKKDSQASFEVKAEDDVSFNVDAETNIAGLVSRSGSISSEKRRSSFRCPSLT